MDNNRLSVLLLPLLLIGATFSRYFRVFQIYNFSLIANRMNLQEQHRKKLSYNLCYVFIILVFVSTLILQIKGEYGIKAYYETVFANNAVLDIFNQVVR